MEWTLRAHAHRDTFAQYMATSLRTDNEIIEVVDSFYILGLTIKAKRYNIPKKYLNLVGSNEDLGNDMLLL